MSKWKREKTEAEKALSKELARHSHFPNLWLHVMDQSEVEAVLNFVNTFKFPTELIRTEAIHVEADNSNRITMIFKKPESWEGENYRKWEEIKVALYHRRKKIKETPENNCEYCNRRDEFNKDLVASLAEVDGTVLFGAEVFIEGDTLQLYLANANDDHVNSDIVKIKYCPICGRRLSGGGEDGNNETNN